MKLSDIKSTVRGLLQDDQYDGDLIRNAANWFVYELFNNTRTRLMEDSTTITANADDTTADFPDDMLAWISIYATAPQVYDMIERYVPYVDFMKSFPNFATATAAQAYTWTDFGNKMRFTAPLSAVHTFQFDYIREPVKMVKDADECEVPDRYEELVMKGTKARIMEIDEDYAEGDQERSLLDPLVTTFIRNEARGGGKTKPTVIRTNRRGAQRSSGVNRLGY